MKSPGIDDVLDLAIVGVGPPALQALYDARQAGLRVVGLDKGPVCGALLKHPAFMRWFSTADKLELCGMPLLVPEKSPTRREYLKYCRGIVKKFDLPVADYREVVDIERGEEHFTLHARDLHGREQLWRARNVAMGTGFYDSPRPLNIAGEELPHVSHRFSEAHGYVGHPVVVVGGGSSAAEVALELWREGAQVTVVMRADRFHTKFWVEPDIENRIKEGSIVCHRNAEPVEITADEVVVRQGRKTFSVPADFVLAMTGYEPDTSMLRQLGAEVDDATNKPRLSEGLETTVPGLYVLGTLCAGVESNVIFIENSRDHGARIVADIVRKRAAEEAGV